jgi:hypothetical protein
MTSSRLKIFLGRWGGRFRPDRLWTVFPTVPLSKSCWYRDSPSLGPLTDQRPLELRRGTQDMEEESRRGILQVRVEPLRNGDEPGAVLLQGLDVVQAVHQRSPEPVELPHQNAIKLPCPRVFHQPIQPRPARPCAAHHVLVRFPDFPPLARGELAEFANLKLTILVRCRNSDVGRYSHGCTRCR